MKYFVILILIGLVAITSVNGVYGLWVPETPDELFKQSETVFVGNITAVNVLEFERSNTYNVEENGVSRIIVENYTQTLDEYTVDIEEFLKNPQESNTITMLEAIVGGVPGRSVSIGGFELGDRVLFYVPKIDGTNQYAPESFKIPKQCDAKSVLEQPRIEGRNSFSIMQEGVIKENNFTANKSMQFVYQMDMRSLDEENLDFQITIRKETDTGKFELVFSENIHTKSKICEWVATAKAEFIPQVGNYQMGTRTTGGTGSTTFGGNFFVKENAVSFDEIIPPLKQLKSGIAIDEITCKEHLQLIIKNKGNPACVKSDSFEKLYLRGWGDCAWNCSHPIPENIIEHSMELAYLDKTMDVQGTDHSVKYRIDGNATVTDSIYSEDSASVIITLDAITSGSLTIELPRTLIDSGHSNCDPSYEREDSFAVLIDNVEVRFEEIITTSEKRTLSISFQENTKKIEIISFCLI
jgi:hypothetical protein